MEQSDKIELQVWGITYNPVQSGAYALLLRQVDGDYRIPVVVGVAEAQSIAMRLENVIPPRPMSHDLMVSILHAFGISIDEVTIEIIQHETKGILGIGAKPAIVMLTQRPADDLRCPII